MSDADPPNATMTDGHDTHDDGHGHEAPAEPLGPFDVIGWGYAIGGGLIGLAVVLALLAARGG